MLSATTNIICGILFIGISIPLVRQKISMNFLYGFRFSKSFDSDENWYKINRYGGKQMIVWSIPLVVTGVVEAFLPAILGRAPESLKILDHILAFAPLVAAVPACTSWRYAKKL